jgi:DNA repair exonuclease SbcCD ATPase subunit
MSKLRERYREALRSRKKWKSELKEAKQESVALDEASLILEKVASYVQRQWYEQLGSVVTRCIQSVFGTDSYEFRLIFKHLANRTQVEMVFEKDEEVYDPMSSTGGGVVDIAAFALRVASLMMAAKTQRKILILDEPFRFVSAGYRYKVAALLEVMSVEFGIQVLMITHMEEIQAGTVIQLGDSSVPAN